MKIASPTTALIVLGTAVLTACGGGGDAGITDTSSSGALGAGTAQGYAADAASMPVGAATALDEGTAALEASLAATATASGAADTGEGYARALAIVPQPAPITVSTACPGGGTITWTLTGGTLAQQLNGRLDAGERYDVVFAACTSAGSGATLDGQLSLTVTDRTDTSTDLALAATALKLVTAQGSFVLDGSARSQRGSSTPAAGGQLVNSHLTAQALALGTSVAGRQASYQLKTLDWTVARTTSATGALVSRSHQGTLDLAASSPARPAATLAIATQGSVSVGSDALVAAGSFSVTTGRDRLGVSYGGGSVTVTLDLGNNGTIDQTWTLTRGGFAGLAG